jgi:hypothetical protein
MTAKQAVTRTRRFTALIGKRSSVALGGGTAVAGRHPSNGRRARRSAGQEGFLNRSIQACAEATIMIRKLSSGTYRLYSSKTDPKTGKRRNLGTFATREQAEKHEREVQYFKRRG